jgi:hypothetical protein
MLVLKNAGGSGPTYSEMNLCRVDDQLLSISITKTRDVVINREQVERLVKEFQLWLKESPTTFLIEGSLSRV